MPGFADASLHEITVQFWMLRFMGGYTKSLCVRTGCQFSARLNEAAIKTGLPVFPFAALGSGLL